MNPYQVIKENAEDRIQVLEAYKQNPALPTPDFMHMFNSALNAFDEINALYISGSESDMWIGTRYVYQEAINSWNNVLTHLRDVSDEIKLLLP